MKPLDLQGKYAWQYIIKNKEKIDKLLVVDYEYKQVKCTYEVEINDIDEKYFKDDFGNWIYDTSGFEYTVLKGVMFKNENKSKMGNA